MGVSKQKAAENRQAIIEAAAKLFRVRGVDAVGLNELMQAAGFTRGGFYNHFKSKDALVSAVIAEAMERGSEEFAEAVAGSRAKRVDPLGRQIDWYLSAEHRRDLVGGCPLSSFVGDVRRLDAATRRSYADGLAQNIDSFESIVSDSKTDKRTTRRKAIALFSEMVGALLLSRAVVDADPALADEILVSARRHLHAARST